MSASPRGFPTTQMLVGPQQSNKAPHTTVQPQDAGLRAALDVHSRFAFRVGSSTVPRTAGVNTGNPDNNGATIVYDSSTPALVGDFVRFIDGNAAFLEIPIIEVAANYFVLGAKLPTALVPASGDEFYIMRHVTQLVDNTGAQVVVANPGPSQFVQDGVDVEVEEDSADPTNNKAFPVKLLARAVDFDFIDASVDNITDAAYTELNASAPYSTEIEISNSTGAPMFLAIGAALSEADFLIIPSEGLKRQAVAIVAGSRLSVKSLSGDLSGGFVTINLFA